MTCASTICAGTFILLRTFEPKHKTILFISQWSSSQATIFYKQLFHLPQNECINIYSVGWSLIRKSKNTMSISFLGYGCRFIWTHHTVSGRKTVKWWRIIHVYYFRTKAVYLDEREYLDTNGFLNVLVRFICGCRTLTTHFVGAKKELIRALQKFHTSRIYDKLSHRGIQ